MLQGYQCLEWVEVSSPPPLCLLREICFRDWTLSTRMEQFYERFRQYDRNVKVQKLEQIVQLFRSNQAHQHADAFYDLKNCYPSFPLFKSEMEFRVYLAWLRIYDLPPHPVLAHVLTQI